MNGLAAMGFSRFLWLLSSRAKFITPEVWSWIHEYEDRVPPSDRSPVKMGSDGSVFEGSYFTMRSRKIDAFWPCYRNLGPYESCVVNCDGLVCRPYVRKPPEAVLVESICNDEVTVLGCRYLSLSCAYFL